MKKRQGDAGIRGRGDQKALAGPALFSASPSLPVSPSQGVASGFSLVELVITVGVMAILTLGVIPLVQVSVKRQKEQQLRESLRQIREAIDQFHREALAGVQMQVNQQQGQNQQNNQQNQNQTGGILADPRVRVFITDQTIFSADNPD